MYVPRYTFKFGDEVCIRIWAHKATRESLNPLKRISVFSKICKQ